MGFISKGEGRGVTSSKVLKRRHLVPLQVAEAGFLHGVGGVVPGQDGQHGPHAHPPLVLGTPEFKVRLVLEFMQGPLSLS